MLSDKGTQMTSVDFKASLLTSLINCGGAVIVSLVIGIPAAYAAGRWQYKGSNDLMFQMLSFRFAPELMVIVPLFVIYNQIGLFDTKVGMIWVLQLVTMPLVVWILRSYFQDLPEDLEQAALLDGYTRAPGVPDGGAADRAAGHRRRRAAGVHLRLEQLRVPADPGRQQCRAP